MKDLCDITLRVDNLIKSKNFEPARDELIGQINLRIAHGNKEEMIELYKILFDFENRHATDIPGFLQDRDIMTASGNIRRFSSWSEYNLDVVDIIQKSMALHIQRGMFSNFTTEARYLSDLYMGHGRIPEARQIFDSAQKFLTNSTANQFLLKDWESRLTVLEQTGQQSTSTVSNTNANAKQTAVASSASVPRVELVPLIAASGNSTDESGALLHAHVEVLKNAIQKSRRNVEQQLKDIQTFEDILQQMGV